MSAIAMHMPARRTPPHKWTVPEFHKLRALGLFDGRRPVLLNGVILEQGPMDAPHANGIERTDTAIRLAFGPGWRFRVQLPLVLNLHTDPVPDLAIVAGALVGNAAHPTTAALVIEVSDTTFDTDTTDKAELYATAGIADYWVLDVTNRELHVFRDPQPLPANRWPGCEAERFVPPSPAENRATAYRTHTVHGAGDTVSPLAAPNAAVAVADLLP